MNHCVNRHTWALGESDHEQLDEDEARSKGWLSASGPEIVALEKVITDRRFLNTVNHYVTCQ